MAVLSFTTNVLQRSVEAPNAGPAMTASFTLARNVIRRYELLVFGPYRLNNLRMASYLVALPNRDIASFVMPLRVDSPYVYEGPITRNGPIVSGGGISIYRGGSDE